eukprot:762853-Hanusia_phi.AAC.2
MAPSLATFSISAPLSFKLEQKKRAFHLNSAQLAYMESIEAHANDSTTTRQPLQQDACLQSILTAKKVVAGRQVSPCSPQSWRPARGSARDVTEGAAAFFMMNGSTRKFV